MTNPWLSPRLLPFAAAALIVTGALSASAPASAQNCSMSTPAKAVVTQLWGSLRPGDIDLQGQPAQLPDDRDSTDYTGNNLPNQFRPLYSSVEAENGYVFTSYADGFRIWNVQGGNAELPSMISAGDIRSGAGCSASGFWIVTPACTELKQFFWDIDTPPGRDDIFAMSGIAGIGMSIIDATNKQQPSLYYQEEGKGSTPQGSEVFVDTISGRDYAFLAANSGTTTQGVFLYDMTAARALGRCGENTNESIQCPGVYKGRIGPGVGAVYLDGVTTSNGRHLLAVSSGGFSQSDKGIQIWDVTNISSPVNLESSNGRLLTNQINYGVALWEQSSHQYLAVNIGTGAQIYDITSCVSAGGCSSLGSPIWSGNWTQWGQAPQGADRFYVTFSRSNGRPMLYFGSNDQCSGGRQREFLFDASSASAPVEITPRATISVSGHTIDYWSWYYSGNSLLGDLNFAPGFSRAQPSHGKFLGSVFYRAANTIFDAHVWTNATPQPPTANFDFSPATNIYAGTPVTFTDTSTGTETSRLWTFPADASTTSSTITPVTVSFSTEGVKSVTLEAINSLGSTTKTKTFTVLNPAPSIGGVAHAPAGTPLTCQSVTFTASGLTGNPSPSLSWVVKDGSNSQVYPGSGSVLGNPFVLPAGALGAGSYSAVVSGTNGHPPDAVVSHAFSLAAPTAITFNGAGGAPVCTNCTSGSPPFGTVDLDASVSGATEYSWDFGDGIFHGYADNDPTYNAPTVSFSYASQGPRAIRVKVRNCAGNELVSQTLTVTINQVQPVSVDLFSPRGCIFNPCVLTAGPITFDVQVSGGPTVYEYDWTGLGIVWDTTTGAPVNGTVTHTYAVGAFQPKIRIRRGTEPYIVHNVDVAFQVDSATPPPPPPPVSISVTGSGGQINQALTFNATPHNCTAVNTGWTWNTGGGTGSSTSSSIQITWTSGGTKTVTASNSGCSASPGSVSVTITDPGAAPLVASYVSNPANPKTGDTITFDGTSSQGGATGYTWDLGGGLLKSGSTITYSFATAGTYPVKLEVSKPGSGASCSLGLCTASITKQIVVSPSTPPPPPLLASFETTPACEGGFGAELCTATTGQSIQFRSTSSGDPTGYTWNFSDGPLVGLANTTHTWSAAGTYAVRLTITRGTDTAFAQKTFTVSAPPAPLGKVAIIPWVIQNNNADVELSDLYLYNPGPQDTHLTITYHNRGIPSPNPPTIQRTLVAGATSQVLALLGQFHVDNTSGFISVLAPQGEPQPMMVGFHQSFDGSKRFGQVLPGFALGSPTSGPAIYHLIGLHDTTDRGTTFGATNADYSDAHYSLRFFDRDGVELGSRPSTALAGNSQEQLDRSAQQALGVNNDDDYRIEVDLADGGNVYPFADVRWASSDDAGLVTARREGGRPRQYLLGMFNGVAAKNTKFSSDAVLVNPTDQPMAVTLSFVTALGGKSPAARSKTLQAGQTLRVADVLNSEFKLKTGAGIVVIDSAGVGGVYPVVVGDTYNTAGASRFGQLVPSVDDRDVATAGHTQALIGLQEDKLYKSTLWFHNPAGAPASAELTFRKLDGTVLSRLVVNVGAGKALQVPARVNKGLPKSFTGAFTVEVKVNAGQLYSGAQVLNKGTNDPSFNLGQLVP